MSHCLFAFCQIVAKFGIRLIGRKARPIVAANFAKAMISYTRRAACTSNPGPCIPHRHSSRVQHTEAGDRSPMVLCLFRRKSRRWCWPPSSSLMKTLAETRMALTRISALVVAYRTHAVQGRGHCGHRPCPEQPPLNPTSTAENEDCCGSARRHCTGEASRQQGATNG